MVRMDFLSEKKLINFSFQWHFWNFLQRTVKFVKYRFKRMHCLRLLFLIYFRRVSNSIKSHFIKTISTHPAFRHFYKRPARQFSAGSEARKMFVPRTSDKICAQSTRTSYMNIIVATVHYSNTYAIRWYHYVIH